MEQSSPLSFGNRDTFTELIFTENKDTALTAYKPCVTAIEVNKSIIAPQNIAPTSLDNPE